MESDSHETTFQPVLLLNSTYEPLSVVGWHKAMKLLFLDKVEVLQVQPKMIHSVSAEFSLPSVLRLLTRVSVPRKKVAFTRHNIFLRDDFTCQYCGQLLSSSRLTLDHVLPKSRGGSTTWSNMVTCCVRCNRTKGDLTPTEADMPLLSTPKEPQWSPMLIHSQSPRTLPSCWKQYLWF